MRITQPITKKAPNFFNKPCPIAAMVNNSNTYRGGDVDGALLGGGGNFDATLALFDAHFGF